MGTAASMPDAAVFAAQWESVARKRNGKDSGSEMRTMCIYRRFAVGNGRIFCYNKK